MAETTEDRLTEAVGTVAKLAKKLRPSDLVSIEIYPGANGEVPYRLKVREDIHPVSGLARVKY